MTDNEIIECLRAADRGSVVMLVDKLEELVGELSHSVVVTYLKRAFPQIPLRVLLEAGAWHRLGQGMMTDQEAEQLLRPWLR